MKTQYLHVAFVGLAVAVFAVPPCSAQRWGTVEFSPIVGAYVPGRLLPGKPPPLCLKGTPCDLVEEVPRGQQDAIALGGRVTAWVGRGIAVEGSVWYSPSSVRYSPSSITGYTTPGSAGMIVGSNVRLLLSTGRGATGWAYLVAGPAYVSRAGNGYSGLTDLGSLGGVVGAGAHLRVGRSLALRGEIEDYLYSVQGYQQQDFVVSVGLSVASRIGSATTP